MYDSSYNSWEFVHGDLVLIIFPFTPGTTKPQTVPPGSCTRHSIHGHCISSPRFGADEASGSQMPCQRLAGGARQVQPHYTTRGHTIFNKYSPDSIAWQSETPFLAWIVMLAQNLQRGRGSWAERGCPKRHSRRSPATPRNISTYREI